MNRTPVCRDFLRGSCRFGSRCKFSHDTSQQQRQQSSNPFGFGVRSQGQQQSIGGNYYGPLVSERQDKNQSQVAAKDHRCNDPKECKQQIKEDFEHELPVFWRLTCYAHGKFLPNDVVGDASFEELRAHAYAAGKQGMSFDSVVQNERSMFSAKKREFDFLLSNPYPGPAVSGNSGSFTNNPLRQEALKMPFGTVAPVSSSSPFMTSNSFAGPTEALSGFGGVKESGGFSFGLGASSGTANGVPIPNSLLPESPPFRGFSFGVQPSKTGQVSSPQNVFSSSSQPFSGFGQTSLNFNSVMSNPSSVSSPQYVFSSSPQPFSGFGQTSLDFNSITGNPSPAPRDLFGRGNSFQATNETEVSASLPPPSQLTLGGQDSMTQMVTELTKQMPAAPFSHQYVGLSDTKADIWSKETWDLGEIPEEEPPLYAR